jgi:glycyl-tRNA synthetase beta subunit
MKTENRTKVIRGIRKTIRSYLMDAEFQFKETGSLMSGNSAQQLPYITPLNGTLKNG